jgi:hypothetical protein
MAAAAGLTMRSRLSVGEVTSPLAAPAAQLQLFRRDHLGLMNITRLAVGTLLLVGCQAEQDPALTVRMIPSDSQVVAPPQLDSSFTLDPDDALGGARQALEAYYDALANGEYDCAYYLWADSGRASNQTLEAFRDGFTNTNSTRVRIGEGRLEGAAGSQYAEFRVVVEATSRQQAAQRFQGSYVLRRSLVDGASESQREWRIYSARMRQLD